jgi:Fur family ferric uptake transcriptional regulator
MAGMPRSTLVLSEKPRPPSIASEPQPYAPACSIFRRHLKGEGLKFTPERAAILDAALRREGLFSADMLVDDLKGSPHRVSRATVYRTLTHLHDAGLLKQVFFDNKQSYFESLMSGSDNDYMICLDSGRVIEFASDKLRKVIAEVCREHGFEHVSHQLHIYGMSRATRK